MISDEEKCDLLHVTKCAAALATYLTVTCGLMIMGLFHLCASPTVLGNVLLVSGLWSTFFIIAGRFRL